MMFIVVVVAAGLVGLLLRRGSTPPIDAGKSETALAVLEQVSVSGTRQWVLIRTTNTSNPLVLFVHGGPGTSQLALMRKNTEPLEKHFTVVNWDQRGAGKSFDAGADRSTMTMDQFVDDIIDLSSALTTRFDQRTVLLVGHSWGSARALRAHAEHGGEGCVQWLHDRHGSAVFVGERRKPLMMSWR